ncbi:MAG: hypothetical protein WBN04_20985 [Paracoccaceae bacterium]
MKTKIIGLTATLLCLNSAAYGATLLASTSLPELNDFSIDFTDTNLDGLLEYSEIDTFSGFTALSATMLTVNTVPDIAGISIFTFPADFGQTAENWRFINDAPGVSTYDRAFWTYQLILDAPPPISAVPLPASLPLLLGAFALISAIRRRT